MWFRKIVPKFDWSAAIITAGENVNGLKKSLQFVGLQKVDST